ncbi:MAG: Ni/Fe-hydrogenase cytochrome b subunit [Thermodesulfobacteriota bacterium]|nr:Ni/Fe-hydrogenase cytochrome b subunit [Thermodesulfobacteriota bacterium]
MNNGKAYVSPGFIVLWTLTILGIALILLRFAYGLGSITNLNDDMPWGLWISFDILAGIALAAGGFVLAGTIHLFGRNKFNELSRPAILTAFLGYIMFIIALIVDLGRPWNLLNIIFSGNHTSPLYEVGWCVIFYTFVLFLEFLPAVFERFNMEQTHKNWKSLVPWLVIIILSIFIFAMTHSWVWAFFMATIFLAWEISMRIGIIPRDQQMPILLIIAGIILSTLHQSSLGTIYLMAPHKLHVLWYSPLLPVLFFLSAVMVGPAMVIFEAICCDRFLGHRANFGLLQGLSKTLPFFLGIYLITQISDIMARGALREVFQVSIPSVSWWLEVSIGIIIPILLFISGFTKREGGLFLAVFIVAAGVVWNRVNVSIVGIETNASWEAYFPRWSEFFITIGILSGGLLAYRWFTDNLSLREKIQNKT